jgi:hypothetical protein
MANDDARAPDLDDALLQARIDRAVEPYEKRLSPAVLTECRRMLAVILTTHPDAAPLMERIRAELAKKGSGVVARRDPAVLAKTAKRGGGRKG